MWRRLELNRESEFALWTQLSEKLFNPERPESIYADPVWLAGPDRSNLGRVAAYEGRGKLATFVVGSTSLPLYLGEIALGKLVFRKASLVDFRVAAAEIDRAGDLLESVLRLAREDLGDDIVFHIETHGLGFVKEFDSLRASNFSKEWLWLDHGRHIHRFIHFERSFEEYFGQLSGKTRHNIRRNQKKIASDLGGEPRLVRVTEANQVDDFLCGAEQVSKKTYQWQMLGSGLHNTEAARVSYRFAAELGWLRSYLYFVGEEPVAFTEGYQYAGTYQGAHHGYDPALAKYSVGILLWVAVFEDLFHAETPQWFDFGSGDAFYKQCLSNVATEGIVAYLWPPTLNNRIRVGTYRATAGLNGLGNSAAERLKLKARFKKLFRDRARRINNA
jgi:hypothetical protein